MITQPFINGYQMTHLQDSADRGGISKPPKPKESEWLVTISYVTDFSLTLFKDENEFTSEGLHW